MSSKMVSWAVRKHGKICDVWVASSGAPDAPDRLARYSLTGALAYQTNEDPTSGHAPSSRTGLRGYCPSAPNEVTDITNLRMAEH